MQLKFYGLSDKPFELSPDLKFLFVTPAYRKAFETVREGILSRKGLIILTGEVGTGKTMAIYRLIRDLPKTVKTAFVYHSTGSFKEILGQIFTDLEEDAESDPIGREGLTLLDYLRGLRAQKETAALLIDEAQDLSPEVLQSFFHLFDVDPEIAETLQLVLVGQTEFDAKLDTALAAHPHLPPPLKATIPVLSQRESLDYIEHRLNVAGKSSLEIFTPEALSAITRYSGGIPRLINVACDNALFNGYVDSLGKIDLKIIRKVFRNMDGPGGLISSRGRGSAGTLFSKVFSPFSVRRALGLLAVLFLGAALLIGKTGIFPSWKTTKKAAPTSASPQNLMKPDTKITPLKEPVRETEAPSGTLPEPIPPASEEGAGSVVQSSGTSHIRAKVGESLSLVIFRRYGKINDSLIHLILFFNPEVKNKDLIRIDQEIRLPEIKEETLISRGPDQGFVIYLGTFAKPQKTKEFMAQPELQGKAVTVKPILSASDIRGYRLEAGLFSSQAEALEVIRALRRKNLLSFF